MKEILDSRLLRPSVVGGIALILGLVLTLSPLIVLPPGDLLLFLEVGVLFLIYGLLSIGLNLHYGYAGIVNFGHVLFFAVGAYVTAFMITPPGSSTRGIALGLPWPTALLGTIVAIVVIATIVGFVSLPLKEEYVAITTLAAAEIFHELVSGLQPITGGTIGIVSIPQPIRTAAGNYGTYLVATLLLFTALLSFGYIIVRRLSLGQYGRILRAIRADKEVTDMLGKNVFRYEMEVFLVGAILAGIAGFFYTLHIGSVAPSLYTAEVTFLIWIGMLAGGPGNHRAVLGGLGLVMGFQLLTRFLNDLPFYTSDQFTAVRLAAVGLLLILIIRYKPEGIWGNAKEQGVDR